MYAAIASLVIFGICIVLFIIDKIPMAITAILGCTLMVIFQVCDFKTAFGQFASSTVILTMGVMVIGSSISASGLAALIGKWITKISKGKEILLIIGTYLASAAMSMFLTNSAVLAIFIPIIVGLASSNSNIKARNLIMPIAIGCVIGGASTLVGSTQQMTAQGLLEEAGLRTFKTFDFTLVGGILIAVGLIYCLTIGRFLAKKIWGNREEEINIKEKTNDENPKKWKMIVMAIVFVATVVLYITEWIPLAVTSTSAALICIILGILPKKKIVKSVNWNIVFRLAGCLGLAKAIEVSGGTKLIADGFMNIVGNNASPYLIFCILVLLVLVASEFTSNSTAYSLQPTIPITSGSVIQIVTSEPSLS